MMVPAWAIVSIPKDAGDGERIRRSAPSGSVKCRVRYGHPVARSARTSPITGANLKPWPEQGEAMTMFGAPGMRSMMKSWSGVMV